MILQELKKVANYLNKISDLNALKVIFGLFNLHIKIKKLIHSALKKLWKKQNLMIIM